MLILLKVSSILLVFCTKFVVYDYLNFIIKISTKLCSDVLSLKIIANTNKSFQSTYLNTLDHYTNQCNV